jgi:membrane protein YqaA with SNARE-associated domain
VKLHPIVLVHKFSLALYAFLIPLGVWGLGGLALLDSALIPIPGSMDGVIGIYVHAAPHKFLLYCLMAAGASTLGSLVPFYIGRAGGELVLLKRINRERYERMRDRFERQEFIAIMIPSMGPPPTPLKLFQFAAGIFEMKPALYMLATFCGKMTQYTLWSLALIWLGPTILHAIRHELHRHLNIALGLGGAVLLGLIVYVVRRIFDGRKGEALPVEEEALPPE